MLQRKENKKQDQTIRARDKTTYLDQLSAGMSERRKGLCCLQGRINEHMPVELQQTIEWYKLSKEKSSFLFVSVCLSDQLSLCLSLMTGSIMGKLGLSMELQAGSCFRIWLTPTTDRKSLNILYQLVNIWHCGKSDKKDRKLQGAAQENTAGEEWIRR